MSIHSLPPALVEALDQIHTPTIAAYLSHRINSDYRDLMRLKLEKHFSTRSAFDLNADDIEISLRAEAYLMKLKRNHCDFDGDDS